MANPPFVGRQHELKLLTDLTSKKVASLVVIKGRRRIGKSRLIEEFARGKKFYSFAGLPPSEDITPQMQRDEFARQLSAQTDLPEIQADDWTKLFSLLAGTCKSKKIIILFDEISWMGHEDPVFLGKLKNAWDQLFKKNPNLILILCGSVSSWIEKNIITSTGFFGRISLKITLEELPLKECNRLLNHIGFKRSSQEKFMILAVTGGVPWYIELINPGYSAIENIKTLCFEKDGILVDEFNRIFNELFGRKAEICKKIVEYLAQGPAEFSDLSNALNYHSSGTFSAYLEELAISGFISRDYTWVLQSAKDSKLSKYRLSDNYLRFYLKYIAPKLTKIKNSQFENISFNSFPNWEGMMGLQFENLVINNKKILFQALGIKPDEIASCNPFFQNKTLKTKGCQIDYLIQTKHNTLFVCEVKFSRKTLNNSMIQSMREKISRLTIPRGFACLPVLICVADVSDEVIESDYFYKIIAFDELLLCTE